MSEPVSLNQVASLAGQLLPEERQQLAETILRELAPGATPGRRRRLWREIRGSVPFPLCGEDAQAWVSRSRSEAATHFHPVPIERGSLP